MQDYSGRYPASLAPTSQEAGGMTTSPDRQAAAMTAPGSDPVTPMPTGTDEMSQVPRPALGRGTTLWVPKTPS